MAAPTTRKRVSFNSGICGSDIYCRLQIAALPLLEPKRALAEKVSRIILRDGTYECADVCWIHHRLRSKSISTTNGTTSCRA